MDAIYAECRALRQKFIEDERDKLPDYCWTRSNGNWVLRREAQEALEVKADRYYQQCLDERSVRVPRA